MQKDAEITRLKDAKAEGKAEGEIRKARETATKMLSRGMSIEDISDLTGLSVEAIENIASKK
ncbi:MAG: hypothetical protein LBI95_03365 [Holosporales bacterium]|jgi:predicted transposase/invertase (TIGR01784 family)|nr:hypothetical protein [Holosporales bacterium]